MHYLQEPFRKGEITVNLLTADNITKSFGDRYLFKDTSFYLNEGEKVGILGINGTGKSTLLKMLSGIVETDEGSVTRANHIILRFLPQHPTFNDEDTVLQSVTKRFITNENKWDIESQAKNMMTRLGITDFEQPTGQLSGGQKKRLALVSVLLMPSDILVLDEPTNHLDNEMAQWLEETLKNWKGAIIMVTHDRYFLDSVSNRIVEIDKGKIYSYQSNYSGFLLLKAEREDMANAGERKRQSILRKEIEWMNRGARARSTKQKAHIQRYEDLKNADGISIDKKVEMSSVTTRMGKTTVECKNINFSYDKKVLIYDFTYIFLKNDRVGFIGENGCGKTTLMKILAGRMQSTSGDVIVGNTIKIGYYSQEFESDKEAGIAYMNPDLRVIDYIRETAEYVKTKDGSISASQMLERFLFPPEEQYNRIDKLSGGEKRRLNLLRVLMEAPNVLIFDEPTNDLDVKTLTILEDYLDDFEGIVVIVSHDRYFLDRTVNRIFCFEQGNIKQYEGNYTNYANRVKLESNDEADIQKNVDNNATGEEKKKTWGGPKKLKFTYQEQKDYETIEEDINKIEERLAQIEKEMLLYSSDFVKLNALTKEQEEKKYLLEEKMTRWMYLEDLYARIQEQGK